MMTLRHVLSVLLFGYPVPPEMIDPHFPSFLQRGGGLLLTLLITGLSMLIGAILGTALALCRREKTKAASANAFDRMIGSALYSTATVLVEAVRGLPIALLILLTFHLPYRLFHLRLPDSVLAITALSFYSGAYLSEIVRAGFRSFDPSLHHVGRVLGLTPRQVLLKIELPIICRHMLPDLTNLAVTVFKDSSTLAIVAVPELTYVARQMVMSEPINYGLVLLLVLGSYWVLATVLSVLTTRTLRLLVPMHISF
jgi:His/Glu/Gln/Arg/opine family amino acid ABC transporter permease subunit